MWAKFSRSDIWILIVSTNSLIFMAPLHVSFRNTFKQNDLLCEFTLLIVLLLFVLLFVLFIKSFLTSSIIKFLKSEFSFNKYCIKFSLDFISGIVSEASSTFLSNVGSKVCLHFFLCNHIPL